MLILYFYSMKIESLAIRAKKVWSDHERLFKRLKKSKPSDLDKNFQKLHEETFQHIDCLSCANCCKSISPIVKEKDVERLGRQLHIRPSEVIDRYLLKDEHDYVMNSLPCPFLAEDNYCSVYEARPEACRAYPHTDQRKMHTILDITLKNTLYCPAVYEITERLKEIYEKDN